jgi:hypothetical protein
VKAAAIWPEQTLHLTHPHLQIGPEGAIALAAALRVNPVLSYLNLSGTTIGE